jgi:MoaA/NifB/PqqE/SkfB family radical SAM enzyme
MNSEKAPPEEVQIYPTNLCNLKCIFCYQQLKQYDYSDMLSKDKWFNITKELCEMGVESILISGGGEPLYTPEVTLSIMKIAKKYGLDGRLITNGTLWTSKYINKTIEMKWNHVTFSIDGSNSVTHDFLRGANGAFGKTIRNVKLFNSFKKKLKGEFPILELAMVLNKYNYKEVPEIVKLAYKNEIRNVTVEPVCVNNPDVKKIKLNKMERDYFLKEIIPKAKRLADNFGVGTNFSRLSKAKFIEKTGELKDVIFKNRDNDFFNLPCYEPWLWPKIEANGEVWPCSTVQLKVNLKNSSFKEVWFGDEFNKFRENIIKGNLSEECKNCVLTHLSINEEIRKKLTEK